MKPQKLLFFGQNSGINGLDMLLLTVLFLSVYFGVKTEIRQENKIAELTTTVNIQAAWIRGLEEYQEETDGLVYGLGLENALLRVIVNDQLSRRNQITVSVCTNFDGVGHAGPYFVSQDLCQDGYFIDASEGCLPDGSFDNETLLALPLGGRLPDVSATGINVEKTDWWGLR